MAEHLHHRFLNTLVVDGLLCLVLIGGHRGERGHDNNKAILHVLKFNFAFGFIILAVLLQIRVNLVHERILHGLVRCAAVLQPTGVVVVFRQMHAVGKCYRGVDLHIVKRQVFAVAHALFGLPELHGGQRIFAHQLAHMI